MLSIVYETIYSQQDSDFVVDAVLLPNGAGIVLTKRLVENPSIPF